MTSRAYSATWSRGGTRDRALSHPFANLGHTRTPARVCGGRWADRPHRLRDTRERLRESRGGHVLHARCGCAGALRAGRGARLLDLVARGPSLGRHPRLYMAAPGGAMEGRARGPRRDPDRNSALDAASVVAGGAAGRREPAAL